MQYDEALHLFSTAVLFLHACLIFFSPLYRSCATFWSFLTCFMFFQLSLAIQVFCFTFHLTVIKRIGSRYRHVISACNTNISQQCTKYWKYGNVRPLVKYQQARHNALMRNRPNIDNISNFDQTVLTTKVVHITTITNLRIYKWYFWCYKL